MHALDYHSASRDVRGLDALQRTAPRRSAHVAGVAVAASEGACLSKESFISDIPPHRELLKNTRFEMVSVPGIVNPIIHVQRKDILENQLKPWALIIEEMLSHVRSILNSKN